MKDWVESHNAICALLRQAHDALALTSYPPRRKWVGLTEVEIIGMTCDCEKITMDCMIDFANSIQDELKEKNT